MAAFRQRVDPELLPLLDAAVPLRLSVRMLPALRRRNFTTPPVDATDVALNRVPLVTAHGSTVPLHVYIPARLAPHRGCILHLHGGGYVTGSGASVEFRHRPLARRLGCVIVSADYRLAPETRFPGQLHDAAAALTWIVDHAQELGIDPRRIGVMGESAGAGLAAALALHERDQRRNRLAFQHLTYAALDDRTGSTRRSPGGARHPVWNEANNRFAWRALLGRAPGRGRISPHAAPARARHLAGLPPTYIATGELDLLRDENLDYATRLARAGVAVTLQVYPGAFHGFAHAPGPAVANRALRDAEQALRGFFECSMDDGAS